MAKRAASRLCNDVVRILRLGTRPKQVTARVRAIREYYARRRSESARNCRNAIRDLLVYEMALIRTAKQTCQTNSKAH